MRCFILCFTLFYGGLLFSTPTIAADLPPSLEITRITPSGEDVTGERQIVFQFNQKVVPVGRMERTAAEIPITITPAVACEWRWLDTSNLACQLGDATKLLPSTRYQITVETGIKTEAGVGMTAPKKHEFVTKRVKVANYAFLTWRAPTMPHIRLSFNQSVTQESVAKSFYFQRPNGQTVEVAVRDVNSEPESVEEGGDYYRNDEESDEIGARWIVSPKKLLPTDSTIQLKVRAGLQPAQGNELSVDEKTVVEFRTFPEFKFLGIECTALDEETLQVNVAKNWRDIGRCNPLRQVALRFSSPVLSSVVKKNLVITPDLAGGRQDYDPWEGTSDYSQINQPHEEDREYVVWLPELLRAFKEYQLKADKTDFKDEFGRALAVGINLKFATDNRAPSVVFEHGHSVLEAGVDSELPIYFTNIKQLELQYQLMLPTGDWSAVQNKRIKLPPLKNISHKQKFGVRDLLGAEVKSGVVQGYYQTDPVVQDIQYNWFFSQITPYHVQAKVGHYNTLVWVTDFATGQPVAGATVDIYLNMLKPSAGQPNVLATATTDENGIAVLAGLSTLDPKLELYSSYDDDKQRFFIRAKKESDFALLPLGYDYHVYYYNPDYEVSSYSRKQYGHLKAWGTTAQGIYKAGDTIQYKIWVRNEGNQSLEAAPKENYNLTIVDPMGNKVYEGKGLKLSDFGALAGEFTVPKTAPIGWYQFELGADFMAEIRYPLQVLVSDFTPAPFRVTTTLNGQLFKAGETVTVETLATLFAGGPYASAQNYLNAQVMQEDFVSAHPQVKGFSFDVYIPDYYDDVVFQAEGVLSDQGQAQNSFVLDAQSPVLYGKLMVESAVRDDRGKDIAHSASARYVGRDRFVGLKETTWLLNGGQENRVLAVVVNPEGNPEVNVPFQVLVQRQETIAARVKGAGNAYLTQFQHSWVDVTTCSLVSAAEPVECVFTPPQAGTYQLIAKVQDTAGREHSTTLTQWASGRGEVVWETGADNTLNIIPERDDYKVGETARYLVKNPYPNAKALVTVERYGVIKQWITTLADSVAVIDVPIEPDFVPGFYLSVTALSPRVDKPIDEDSVDLGKPTMRLGYVSTTVNEPYKELVVDIQTDKPTYKPRETVTVNFQARAKQADVPAQPIELAVTVLDESVFALLTAGRKQFDPYAGFYSLDALDVDNYSLLLKLVGRQKFEKKGANAGGDGGAALAMRSLFKFVTYWNPALATDAEGKAQIQFTVPDNLTGWRVFAMAATATDRMGLSDVAFTVNQPIEIRPALPNQVSSGDKFEAGFTVMNRTDKARELAIALRADGVVLGETQAKELTLLAEPFKRYNVWLPLAATRAGKIALRVQAGDAEVQDGLQAELVVRAVRATDTAATYGSTLENSVTESLLFPEKIQPDVGSVSVMLTPTVIGGVEGAFTYMRDYPYICWEQKLTKGVMASHYEHLKAYLPDTLQWTESAGLAQATLDLASNYQAPNGGMVYYVAVDERVSPYLSAYTALAFNWLRNRGLEPPAAVEEKLQDYLLNLLRKDEFPSFFSKGMASSVRAVALAALAKRGKVRIDDMQRYRKHVPDMDLFGKAMYLQAGLRLSQTEKLMAETVDMLLAAADQTAGRVAFVEKLDDTYSYLLHSSLRTQCAILGALSEYAEMTGQKDKIGDLPPKLVRTITAERKRAGHWENTQENMFCMEALIQYAAAYEKDKPAMTVRAALDDKPLGEKQFQDVRDAPVTFSQPITAQDVGRKATATITREGVGRLYYKVQMQYALLDTDAPAVNAGIDVRREYHVERNGQWQLLTSPMAIQTGELVRVDLYASLPAPRYHVVVADPVPGGLEPVNRDLATSSQVAANKAGGEYGAGSIWMQFSDWRSYGVDFWSFYHRELRHHAAQFYSEYLPAGNYHLSYVAQAIAPGEFVVMPTHAEQMYEPEVYGRSQVATLLVTKDMNAPANQVPQVQSAFGEAGTVGR